MFKSAITETPLVSPRVGNFFRIDGPSYSGDVSFLSTLRALVTPRMAEDEHLYLHFTTSRYSASELGRITVERAVGAVSHIEENESIWIHEFKNYEQSDNYAWLELVKSSFAKVNSGWHCLEKVTEFYRKTFYVVCFVNPDIKSVVIYTENMDMRKMHYLQCSIFAFLPWYFNPEDGVEPEEMELIQSLREKTSDKYIESTAKIAQKYDFRSANIRNLLQGFEVAHEKQECDRIKNEINRCDVDIRSYNDQIGSLLRARNDKLVRLLGLEAKIAQGTENDSEMMEYFLCNKKLILDSVIGTEITFVVKDYIAYFDEDMALSMIENKRSYIYMPDGNSWNSPISPDDIEKLMRAIFIDQVLKVKFCAAYRFDLRGNVSAMYNYGFGAECDDATPNVHIDRFTCMGNYQRVINDLLSQNNYIGAIEQCIASCESLNFGDGAVMSEFMRRMYGTSGYNANIRCIELPDGRVVKPKEAIKWLNQEQEGQNEQNN